MFTKALFLRRKLLPSPWNYFLRNTSMLLVVEQGFTLKLLDMAFQVLLFFRQSAYEVVSERV